MPEQYVTDSNVSPYTGRPITEWLDDDIELHDADGDEIGNIVEVNPDFVVVQTSTGFLGLGEPRYYYVPRTHITREDDDDWYLSIDKDEFESMNWGAPPTESAWASDWREGDYAGEERLTEGRTRLRRYEEDVDVSKVQREAGEVVVSKRVVEDTRTIDVPVRREEVHVERRAVDDRTAVGSSSGVDSGDAFSNESIRVPVMEEDVEIRKVARPVEEIEITKTATEDTRSVDATVRREEFDVDDQTRNR
jgi:uncharacterized protein (TIGR02271 family)